MTSSTSDTPRIGVGLQSSRGSRPFEGEVAIVTGGASGIGYAVSRALFDAGAHVLLVDRDRPRLDAAAARLNEQRAEGKSDGGVTALAFDVREPDQMLEMAQVAIRDHGRIDMLVASAGILRPHGTVPKSLVQMSAQEWDEVIDVNLKGVFLSNRAVLPTMIAQRRGQIVNVSSTSGRQGRAFDSAYCASKFGVIGLSESVAQEVSRYHVKVHVVLPDAVATPLWEQNGPIPPPPDRLRPESVADVILYLLALPGDTMLIAPVIAAFGQRRRVARAESSDADTLLKESHPAPGAG